MTGRHYKRRCIVLSAAIITLAVSCVLAFGLLSDKDASPTEIELNATSNIFGEVQLTTDELVYPGSPIVVRTCENDVTRMLTLADCDNEVKESVGYAYKVYTPTQFATAFVIAEKERPEIDAKARANVVTIETEKNASIDGYVVKENGKVKGKVMPGETFKTKIPSDTEKQYQVVAFKEERGEVLYSEPVRTQTFFVGYDPDRAVKYARKYALEYNEEEYGNFNPLGGDCANFVSQCILAGGYDEDETWNKHSLAWLNVEAMHDYFADKKVMIENPRYDDFEAGDLIISNDYEELGHVVICTGVRDDGVPIFCGHNNDHLDDPVSIYSDMILIKMCENFDANR